MMSAERGRTMRVPRAEQELLDSVCVEKVVKSQVAEHDEHGVVRVFAVLRLSIPLRRYKPPNPFYQTRAVSNELRECLIQVDPKKSVIGILGAGIIGRDNRTGMRQHVVQPLEKERVDDRQVTHVLMRGPPPLLRRLW